MAVPRLFIQSLGRRKKTTCCLVHEAKFGPGSFRRQAPICLSGENLRKGRQQAVGKAEKTGLSGGNVMINNRNK
jgi:hypothetical protein